MWWLRIMKIRVAECSRALHIWFMVAPVTKHGLVIPPRLLRGVKRVEIRRGKRRITLLPAKGIDPINHLGSKPVRCGLSDGSARHDKHVYGSNA
jgi:hypothetical protein